MIPQPVVLLGNLSSSSVLGVLCIAMSNSLVP